MAQQVDRRRAYRRTRRTAIAVGAALGLTFVVTQPGSAAPQAPSAPAQEAAAFSPGTGQAIALGYKVNPVFGGLSFGITAAESIAAHQNTAGQAQSTAVNLGVIGVSLAGEGCKGAPPTLAAEDQPQPVIVGSDDPGADKGRSAKEAGVIDMFAQATKAPFAKSVTTVADPLGSNAVVQIVGGRATATSGVVAEGIREARALTEIGQIKILGGLITIGDLRWEAVQRTGGEELNQGTFSLGSLKVGPVPVAVPEDAAAQLALLEDTLAAAGLEVVAPEVRQEKGIVFVDPLRIGIIPSDLRDGALNIVLGNQDLRDLVIEQIMRTGCGGDLSGIRTLPASTIVTVLDLALGSISGAGSLSVELGGVQATTGELDGFDGLGVLPDLPTVTPPVVDTPVDTPTVDTPIGTDGDVTVPEPTDESGDDGGDEVAGPVETIAGFEGERGGALLGVGAGGLLLMLLSAEGDRRKMRRAQREIPLEA